MFTGIIEKTAPALSVIRSLGESHKDQGEMRLSVNLNSGAAPAWTDIKLGESIAVNGACLTVAEWDASSGRAEFFLSPETLTKTQFDTLTPGTLLNLERALRMGDRLSGHWVQGHVDGVAHLRSCERMAGAQGETWRMRFELPLELSKYCVSKGSITLQGVSLTINALEATREGGATLECAIIPHTWDHTNLSQLKPGDTVNVEVDILAKYALQSTAAHLSNAAHSSRENS